MLDGLFDAVRPWDHVSEIVSRVPRHHPLHPASTIDTPNYVPSVRLAAQVTNYYAFMMRSQTFIASGIHPIGYRVIARR
jgi:hypothetical protein